MRIGICTRYCCHEATYAAIRIADWAAQHGHDVTLFTMTARPPALSARWDKAVKMTAKLSFTEWVDQTDAVLWTHIPHREQLEWVKSEKKRTYLFPLWHELGADDRVALALAHFVLVPTRAAGDLLFQWGLRNLFTIPWDTGLPLFRKPKDHDLSHPKILFPLNDGACRRMEMTAMDVAARMLYRHPEASLTIMYNSSTIASPGKRRIADIRRSYPGQVRLLRGVPPQNRPLVFQAHDVTLWPTHWESTCMIGLMSVTMGTPVVTFGYRPTEEFFQDNVHGVVVRTAETVNDIGLPRAAPDYGLLDEMAHHLLQDRDFLAGLQQTVLHGIDDRRRVFEDQMSKVIPT